jgi:hypothetical protein
MGKLLSIWGSGLAYPSGFAILDLLCGLSTRDMNPLVFEHVQPHMWNGPRCKELLNRFHPRGRCVHMYGLEARYMNPLVFEHVQPHIRSPLGRLHHDPARGGQELRKMKPF